MVGDGMVEEVENFWSCHYQRKAIGDSQLSLGRGEGCKYKRRWDVWRKVRNCSAQKGPTPARLSS